MKRKSEAEQAPEFAVGQHVKLDKQPLAWKVTQTGVEGFRNRVKIETYVPGFVVPEMKRTVDVIRLSPLTDDEVADIKKSLRESAEDDL